MTLERFGANGSMRLTRWLLLIAAVVGLGCLQVAQRTALYLKGYAVGQRAHEVHTQNTEVSWLDTQVVGLSSPVRLAEVAQERRLQFVAWSTLEAAPRATRTLPHMALAQPEETD